MLSSIRSKKEKYVVSWSPIDRNCIYGKDCGRKMTTKFMQPLTLKEAEKASKQLWGGSVGIYKLILVKKLKGK